MSTSMQHSLGNLTIVIQWLVQSLISKLLQTYICSAERFNFLVSLSTILAHAMTFALLSKYHLVL